MIDIPSREYFPAYFQNAEKFISLLNIVIMPRVRNHMTQDPFGCGVFDQRPHAAQEIQRKHAKKREAIKFNEKTNEDVN